MKEYISRNLSPSDWPFVTIKDICYLGRGRVISQIEIDNNPGVYPVYSSQTANNGEMGKIDTYDFEGEYITWTTDGAYAGSVFYRIGRFNCTNVCGTLLSKDKNQIHMKYLSYALGKVAKKYVSYIGNPKLMNNIMGEIAIALPRISEQKIIASVLTTIDNLIEKTEQIIEKLKNIKKGMMQDLFSRGVTTDGRLRPPKEEAPELYKESELGWIPKEWEVVSIDSITQFVGSGITPRGGDDVYTDKGIMLLRSQNIQFDGLKLNDVAYISQEINCTMERTELKEYDVLLNITGASIGRCCLFNQVNKANVNQHVCIIRLYNPKYESANILTHLISTQHVQKQIINSNAGGSREGLNYQQVRKLTFIWPSVLESEIISKIIDGITIRLSQEKKNIVKLKNIKKGLMDDLLTGRVRVTEMVEDEN